jgi:hypothetical protein
MLFRRPVLYVDVTSYSQFFFGSELATWSPVRLLKDGSILNLSDVVCSEIAWYKDLNLFALNGISQQKSSKSELSELVSLYLKCKKSPAVEASIGQNLVAEGMGVRGRLQFGEVTAVLLPSVDQVLGNWVRS